MRIGLALPHYAFSFPSDGSLTWERVADAARRGEALGFDSLWVSDHFFLDISRYGGPPGPQGTPELFTTLAGLTQITERVRLGSLVASAPLRHPAHVAKMAAAIDLASGGRLDLGIGAGWYEAEFRAFGYPAAPVGDRFSLLEEAVEVIGLLFSDGPVDFRGRHFTLSRAYNHPPPAQDGGPPIWVGSKGGSRSLRLVARHAAGWNTVWKWTPGGYAEKARLLERICEREGRDPATVGRSLGLYALVGESRADLERRYRVLQAWTPGGALDGTTVDEYARDTLTGTVEDCVERAAAFAALGAEELIVAPASLPFAVADWSLVELVSEQLLPAIHNL